MGPVSNRPLFFFILVYLEDLSLIQGCLKNDRKAQFQLYKSYYSFVSGICLRYLVSEELARETTNDIFLKVFTKISLFNSAKGSFATWLRTISVHTCLDKIKLGSFSEPWEYLQEESESVSIPSSDSMEVRDVLKLINELPDRQRIIFHLFVVEGYSHDEIAQLLGISSGSSRWQISDARHKLKEIFIQNGHPIK